MADKDKKNTPISDADIEKITDIINKHFAVLSMIATGMAYPDANLLRTLGLSQNTIGLVSLAYQLGVANMSSTGGVANLTPVQVRNRIQATRLSPSQTATMNQLCRRAQQHLNTMNQRTVASTVSSTVNINFQMYQSLQNVASNTQEISRGKIIQQLRDSTGDMKRDWHRVVQTELWDAKLHGEANAILDGSSPFSSDKEETMVYKRPAPDCCPICKKLYLESDGVTPKVFKLADLIANGINYGKKQADWVATLGIVHPNCQCTLGVKPKDTEFDKDGNLVLKR